LSFVFGCPNVLFFLEGVGGPVIYSIYYIGIGTDKTETDGGSLTLFRWRHGRLSRSFAVALADQRIRENNIENPCGKVKTKCGKNKAKEMWLFLSQLLKLNILLTFCSIGEPSGHRRSFLRSRSCSAFSVHWIPSEIPFRLKRSASVDRQAVKSAASRRSGYSSRFFVSSIVSCWGTRDPLQSLRVQQVPLSSLWNIFNKPISIDLSITKD